LWTGWEKKSESSSSSSDSGKEDKKKVTKKEVKKKSKSVILSAQGFSKIFSDYFNNKKLSDMTIKFEGSGDVYHAHKNILQTQSDVFDNLTDHTYTFTKDHDEEAAKNLVKFFYTGTLEYSNESQLVTFMILANKLKVKSIGEFKVPPKVYLNGILAYVEKDLNNRITEFDNLVESVNFKKLEKEDLTKLYAKKKWLQKSSSFLNIIIMKDIASDDDGSGSEKDEDSEEEKEDEDEEDEEEGGKAKFDAKKLCVINHWKIEKNKITYIGSGSYEAIGLKSGKKMKLKVGNTGSWSGFGAISDQNIKNAMYVMNTSTVNGFYMYTCNGYTWENGKGPISNGKTFAQGDEFKVTIKGKKLIIEKLIKKKGW